MTQGTTCTEAFITAMARLVSESPGLQMLTLPRQATEGIDDANQFYNELLSLPVRQESIIKEESGFEMLSAGGQDFVCEYVLRNGTTSKSTWDPIDQSQVTSRDFHSGVFLPIHGSNTSSDQNLDVDFTDNTPVSYLNVPLPMNGGNQQIDHSAAMPRSISSSVEETHLEGIKQSLGQEIAEINLNFPPLDSESDGSQNINESTEKSCFPNQPKRDDASIGFMSRVPRDHGGRKRQTRFRNGGFVPESSVHIGLKHQKPPETDFADSLDPQRESLTPDPPTDSCQHSSSTACAQPNLRDLFISGSSSSGHYRNDPLAANGHASKASAKEAKQTPATTNHEKHQKENLLTASETTTAVPKLFPAQVCISRDHGTQFAQPHEEMLGTASSAHKTAFRRKEVDGVSASDVPRGFVRRDATETVGTTAQRTPRNTPSLPLMPRQSMYLRDERNRVYSSAPQCRFLPCYGYESPVRVTRGESLAFPERSMSLSSSTSSQSRCSLLTSFLRIANPSTFGDTDLLGSVNIGVAETLLGTLRQRGIDTCLNNLTSDNSSNLASVSSSVFMEFTVSLSDEEKSSADDCKFPQGDSLKTPILWLKKDATILPRNLMTVDTETSVTLETGTPPPIVCPRWQGSRVFSSTGGTWQQPGSDVILSVPPDAVERGESVRVQVGICADVNHIGRVLMLQEGEKIVSPLAEYWSGSDFRFRHSVRITLPHALPKDVDLSRVHVHRVTRDQAGNVVVTRLRNSLENRTSSPDEHQADLPYFNLSSTGELHVTTDCFSGYVCSYIHCGLRQELPVLTVMVCGSYKKDGDNRLVLIRTFVWDERLNIADFQRVGHDWRQVLGIYNKIQQYFVVP